MLGLGQCCWAEGGEQRLGHVSDSLKRATPLTGRGEGGREGGEEE